MNSKYKIILDYINDLSVEIKDPEALLIARERILKYKLDLNITSKPLKNKKEGNFFSNCIRHSYKNRRFC